MKLHLVLYIEVNSVWTGGGFISGLYRREAEAKARRLANDLNGTPEQKRGLGGVIFQILFVSHDTPAAGIITLESRIPAAGIPVHRPYNPGCRDAIH